MELVIVNDNSQVSHVVGTKLRYFMCLLLKDLDCKTVRIFAYSNKREQSNERSGTRLKTESEACEARALRACKTLTPRFTDFLTDFEEKTDCFAVDQRPGARFSKDPETFRARRQILKIKTC